MLPPDLLTGERGLIPLVVPYEVAGRPERLVYLSQAEDLAAYEELRSGFTAAVSHELRTPLARLLTLLETAALPGEDVRELVDQARAEVAQITELIDEVLFLSELESGRARRVARADAGPAVLESALEELAEHAARADVALHVEGDPDVELAIRPRMLRVVARNLAENAIRYAGPDTTFTLSVERAPAARSSSRERTTSAASPSRSSRGCSSASTARIARVRHAAPGLGLAIVKHVVTQAGGTVEARGGPMAGPGIRCTFP